MSNASYESDHGDRDHGDDDHGDRGDDGVSPILKS